MPNRLVAIGFAIVGAFVVLAIQPFEVAAASLTFNPAADALVSSAQATKNYGRTASLDVRTSSSATSRSYLAFDIANLTGPVTAIRLHLYVTDGSVDSGTAYAASSAWTEGGITWKTAPAPATLALSAKTSVSAKKWVDLTIDPSAIQGNGRVTLVLASTSSDTASYASREATNKPQLIVTLAPAVTATPTPTATPSPSPTVAPPPSIGPDPTAPPTSPPLPTDAPPPSDVAPSATALPSDTVVPPGSASPSDVPPSSDPLPPSGTPSASIDPSPSASVLPAGYTFYDDFDGPSLNPLWQRDFHCCGALAGLDPSLSSLAGGYLAIRASSRSNGWYSDLIDTKYTWTQRYGTFEARIEIPMGTGLWPAFWSYYSSGTGYVGELDTVEVCANPVGVNNGNDVTLLHNYVHWANNGSAGLNTRTVDLSDDFHVYGIDWRADHVSFFLDGVETWRYADTTHIPNVALPLILNLGIGGSWCGAPDATTPDGATMLVDWVHARP